MAKAYTKVACHCKHSLFSRRAFLKLAVLHQPVTPRLPASKHMTVKKDRVYTEVRPTHAERSLFPVQADLTMRDMSNWLTCRLWNYWTRLVLRNLVMMPFPFMGSILYSNSEIGCQDCLQCSSCGAWSRLHDMAILVSKLSLQQGLWLSTFNPELNLFRQALTAVCLWPSKLCRCEIYSPRQTHLAELFPESRDIIEACKASKTPMAIASRSPTPPTARAFLKALGTTLRPEPWRS